MFQNVIENFRDFSTVPEFSRKFQKFFSWNLLRQTTSLVQVRRTVFAVSGIVTAVLSLIFSITKVFSSTKWVNIQIISFRHTKSVLKNNHQNLLFLQFQLRIFTKIGIFFFKFRMLKNASCGPTNKTSLGFQATSASSVEFLVIQENVYVQKKDFERISQFPSFPYLNKKTFKPK